MRIAIREQSGIPGESIEEIVLGCSKFCFKEVKLSHISTFGHLTAWFSFNGPASDLVAKGFESANLVVDSPYLFKGTNILVGEPDRSLALLKANRIEGAGTNGAPYRLLLPNVHGKKDGQQIVLGSPYALLIERFGAVKTTLKEKMPELFSR